MIIIGIDNGVSGSMSIFNDGLMGVAPIPVVNRLNYQKTERYINRLDFQVFRTQLVNNTHPPQEAKAYIERPMVNPERFQATMSAIRCLEGVLIALEDLGIAYDYIDSRQWQKELLPAGIRGAADLKRAAIEVARRLYPQVDLKARKIDADGLLIGHWAYMKERAKPNIFATPLEDPLADKDWQ